MLQSKKILDKTDFEELRNFISNNNWCLFYNQTCAEGMFTVFTDILEKALLQCAPKKQFLLETIKAR